MPRAIWNGAVIAESSDTIKIEGRHYFPPSSLNDEYLRRSDAKSTCYWKGVARYLDVVVDGEVNEEAGWTYPKPSEAAAPIRDHVAFWRGVRIEALEDEPKPLLYRMKEAVGL